MTSIRKFVRRGPISLLVSAMMGGVVCSHIRAQRDTEEDWMTSRELVKAAISHQPCGRVPHVVDLDAKAWEALAACVEAESAEAFLDNDVRFTVPQNHSAGFPFDSPRRPYPHHRCAWDNWPRFS